MPVLYVIGGSNGAGKTTLAKRFLPDEAQVLRFLNVDEIARGLSPLKPDLVSVKAGRILLTEVQQCLKERQSFALESTLSGKGYVKLLRQARAEGYKVVLVYFWIKTVENAIDRVKARRELGGHDVPEHDIRRRFPRSIENFLTGYLPLADIWSVWDSSGQHLKLIASSNHLQLTFRM
jgi:predicted ABC-type ATPase